MNADMLASLQRARGVLSDTAQVLVAIAEALPEAQRLVLEARSRVDEALSLTTQGEE